MSVTTSARLNLDRLRLEVGADVATAGAVASSTGNKVVSSTVTDAALQAAITAHAFVDRDANETDLRTKVISALAANDTYRAIASPTNAQVIAQVDKLTRECSGIIRLLLSQLDTTAGT